MMQQFFSFVIVINKVLILSVCRESYGNCLAFFIPINWDDYAFDF